MSTNRTYIVGVDPGVTGNCGFAAFDAANGDLIYTAEIGSERRELRHRLADISCLIRGLLLDLSADGKNDVSCFIEYFVMRGKSGETLQRLVGAVMAQCPDPVSFAQIQNSTVKLQMAGHGHADKAAVAIGVLDFFDSNYPDNKETSNKVKALIRCKNFDTLDALAIGITGWQKSQSSVSAPKKKARPTKRGR